MVSGKNHLSGTDQTRHDWNEIDFVPWNSFRRMAPSILNLEVARLNDLIAGADDIEYRNALVRSRFELEAFVEVVKLADVEPKRLPLTRLQAAIVNLPMEYPGIDEHAAQTLAYILDRLQYVHTRIRFVYQ